MAREFLVSEADRRRLLDESMRCLFNSRTRLIDTLTDDTHSETEEAIQLRVLLLWLAWSIGDKVPESSVDAFAPNGQNEQFRQGNVPRPRAPYCQRRHRERRTQALHRCDASSEFI